MPTKIKPPFPVYPPSAIPQVKTKHMKGFAVMDPQRVREIASLGGRTAHEQGRANTWNSQTAREAGLKGAEARRVKRSARIQAMSRPGQAAESDSNNQTQGAK